MTKTTIKIEGKAFANKAIAHLATNLVPFSVEYRYPYGDLVNLVLCYTDKNDDARRVCVESQMTLDMVLESVEMHPQNINTPCS